MNYLIRVNLKPRRYSANESDNICRERKMKGMVKVSSCLLNILPIFFLQMLSMTVIPFL